MKLLSLDTSTKNFSLAVTDGRTVLAAKNIILNKVLSDSIIPFIKEVLRKAKVPLKSLDAFAVGLGPGSFTSLRVGLATVKGLSFASQKPVVGIGSLDCLAMNVKANHIPICALTDARRKMIYGCIFQKEKDKLKRKSQYLLTTVSELLKHLEGQVIFIGDGLEIYKREILELSKKKIKPVFTKTTLWFPQATNLSLLALERAIRGKFDDARTLTPLYLYKEDCQVQP